MHFCFLKWAWHNSFCNLMLWKKPENQIRFTTFSPETHFDNVLNDRMLWKVDPKDCCEAGWGEELAQISHGCTLTRSATRQALRLFFGKSDEAHETIGRFEKTNRHQGGRPRTIFDSLRPIALEAPGYSRLLPAPGRCRNLGVI